MAHALNRNVTESGGISGLMDVPKALSTEGSRRLGGRQVGFLTS